MILNDKVYDILKWLLITFIPSLILLIVALGSIYGFDTEIITLTISAIATFIGSLIGISNINYNKNNTTNTSNTTNTTKE